MHSTSEVHAPSSGESRLNGEVRTALSQGELEKAIYLLERDFEVVGVKGKKVVVPVPTDTDKDPANHRRCDGNGDDPMAEFHGERSSVGPEYGQLISLLWQRNHEPEAQEVFDLARGQAREAAERSAARQGRGLQRKPQAGIPGLHLDLPREVCHGIMRTKLQCQDWEAVIDMMRASSCVPRRGPPGGSLVGPSGPVDKAEAGTRPGVLLSSAGTQGCWAPNEETYALALEACGRVSGPDRPGARNGTHGPYVEALIFPRHCSSRVVEFSVLSVAD